MLSFLNDVDAYPSYSPTLSCTNSSTSSGRYEGRKAVVKSSCFKNIRYHFAAYRVDGDDMKHEWWWREGGEGTTLLYSTNKTHFQSCGANFSAKMKTKL